MTKKELMYERLKDLQWHTTEECVEAVGHRFGASVLLLRKEGYDIRSEREDDKWVYRMMSLEKGPELGSKVKMYLTMDSVIALANGNITSEVEDRVLDVLVKGDNGVPW